MHQHEHEHEHDIRQMQQLRQSEAFEESGGLEDSAPGAHGAEPVVIDCDDCAVRGPGCQDCVVSVLLRVPEELLAEERAALEVLAEAGMAPRLRLVPIHRRSHPGVA